MKTLTLIVLGACMAATTAFADSRTQLLNSVRFDLPRYVSDVDPNTLSTSQLGLIKSTIYGDGSEGYKQSRIRSIVGGQHSLFGTLRLGIKN